VGAGITRAGNLGGGDVKSKSFFLTVFVTAGLFATGLGPAIAQCSLPYQLQNGDPPDATKVMANYNALVTCMLPLSPTGQAYSAQTNDGDGTFGSIPPLGDGQLIIGSSNSPPQVQQLAAGQGIAIANAPGEITISASFPVGTNGSGLYRQILSATPTLASTGLLSWLNQGTADVVDSSVGLAINAPSSGSANNITGRQFPAPLAPYKLTALIAATRAPTGNNGIGLGWYNGTDRLHLISLTTIGGGLPKFEVTKWNSVTSLSATDAQTASSGYSEPFWVQISDNGSTVSFAFSQDGANFLTLFSVAKSSGWLGASGYSNIVFFINPLAGATTGTLMSWKVE
jgi:hypothetical protein